jgi:hypothetical protein
MRYLITILLLSSCGLVDLVTPNYIDPELMPYVESFYDEAQARGWNDLPPVSVVKFANLSNKYGHADYRKNEVTIDRDWWEHYKATTPCYNEKVMFHEMAHATMFQDHRGNSIMCSSSDFMGCEKWIIEMYASGRRAELLDELFFISQ